MMPITPEQEKELLTWKSFYPYPQMGLIEAMRAVQEWHLSIGPRDEEVLARLFGVPRTRVHEVATFFPHFTQRPTGRFRIGLCQGLSCALAGSSAMAECLRRRLGTPEGVPTQDGRLSFEMTECLGACDQAPALVVNEELRGPASEKLIEAILADPGSSDLRPARGSWESPQPEAPLVLTKDFGEARLHELETFRGLGGYQGLEKALAMKRSEVLEEVQRSHLRGLGGAGFPTGLKWSTLPPEDKASGSRAVVANFDESEPGCFKDRVLVERSPHQLIEGLLIASFAVGAKEAFIFIRGEYKRQYQILSGALGEAERAGLLGGNILGRGFSCRVMIMRGAGAYISGLDTALLETMEGKKAWPRQPPPFPTAYGLMGRPTVVNNVETLSMLPVVLKNGGEYFARLGARQCGGTAVYSVSGHVERPGVYEFPMGTPLIRILEAAGGVRRGLRLKAVIPGGVSTPVLSAEEAEVPMDFESLRRVESFLGAGGVIVLDETADMAEVAHNVERFLAHESCGQCTPCREGSRWSVRILERLLSGRGTPEDLPNLQRIGEGITGKVICALGDTVGLVTRAIMKKFPEDFKSRTKPPQGAAASW